MGTNFIYLSVFRAETDKQGVRDHLGHQDHREKKDLKVLREMKGLEGQW